MNDDDVALTRKAIDELLGGSIENGNQLERKMNPLGRLNPNKRFLDRTLNSAMQHNKRELARSQINSREKLRELDEREKRRAKNSFYNGGDAGYMYLHSKRKRFLEKRLNMGRSKVASTNGSRNISRTRSNSSSSSSRGSSSSRSQSRKNDTKRHHRKKKSKRKKCKYKKSKRFSRSSSRSGSISSQSIRQSPQNYNKHKVIDVAPYANDNFLKMESFYMQSNSAAVATLALAFGHIQKAMELKNTPGTNYLQETNESDKLSDSTLNSSLLGELLLSESTSEDKDENEILTIDVSSSDELESLAEDSKNSRPLNIAKQSSSSSDSCISLGSDDDTDYLANTQKSAKESVVVELLSSAGESNDKPDFKCKALAETGSEEEAVDLTED